MPKSTFSAKYQCFRRMLIEARQAKRITQIVLAHRLGRSQSYVSKFERGERRLDVVEFLEIAEQLDLDVLQFVKRLLER